LSYVFKRYAFFADASHQVVPRFLESLGTFALELGGKRRIVHDERFELLLAQRKVT
jgi:hypothetical protein